MAVFQPLVARRSIRAARSLLFLLLSLASIPTPEARAEGPTVPSYTIEARVDYGASTLDVTQSVRFRNQTGQTLDRAVFHAASAYLGAFTLQGATVQGQPVTASLGGTVLDVPLPTPLAPGGTVEVGLSFRLNVPAAPGRLSAGRNSLALGNWFPTLAVFWGDWDRHQYTDVGDAFTTEASNFDLRLTTTVPLTVASTGRVLESTGTLFRLQALGVRDFGLSLSPDYALAEAQAGSTTVRAYTFSQQKSRVYADAAARFLRWYGQRLGAYPYPTFTVAEIDLPTSYGGMEYPGLMFISSGYSASSAVEAGPTEALIGHEVAHQWFYSQVGDDQVNDPWLDEAFASFLPEYYYREVAPSEYQAFAARRVSGSTPLNSTVYDFPDDGAYFGVVYRRGARFLDELRQTMGDGPFEEALRDIVATYTDKIATPRAVLDLFQRHSDANLNPLIVRYFTYGAFTDPRPPSWRVESPDGPLVGSLDLFVGAEFPLAQVEVWLDQRQLYAGPENALRLELSGVEPGEYVLLVKVLDPGGALFERARRVRVGSS